MSSQVAEMMPQILLLAGVAGIALLLVVLAVVAVVGAPRARMKKRIARETHAAQYTAVVDAIRAVPESQVINLLTGDVLREWLQAELALEVETDDMAAMLARAVTSCVSYRAT